MHSLGDVLLALGAKSVENSLNVHLVQETLGRVLQLTNLHWQFLNFDGASCRLDSASLAHRRILLHLNLVLKLLFGNLHTNVTETRVNRLVVYDGPVQGKQVKTAGAVGVLQIRGVQEFENCVQGDLHAHVLEGWGTLRNLEQEDITFFVRSFGIVGTVQAILDHIYAILATQAVCILLRNLRLLIA